MANTGLAMHRLGVPVRLVGKVGDDLFGGAVRDALPLTGWPRGMLVSAGEATSYTIVINPPGVDRTFLHCPGANETFAADACRSHLRRRPPLPLRLSAAHAAIYADGGAELERLLARVQKAGLVTSLDMCQPPATEAGRADWRALLARTLPPSTCSPRASTSCCSCSTGRPANDGEARADALDRAYVAELSGGLLDMGGAVVAIKLGDQGLYLRTSGHVGELCGRLDLDATAWIDREVLSPCFRPRGGGHDRFRRLHDRRLLRAAARRGQTEAATIATAVGAC